MSLGEIYKGIELKLKAYGNDVEKLFYVKPGANPGDIRVKIEGAKEDNPPKSPFKKGGLKEDTRVKKGDFRNSTSLVKETSEIPPFTKGGLGGIKSE